MKTAAVALLVVGMFLGGAPLPVALAALVVIGYWLFK